MKILFALKSKQQTQISTHLIKVQNMMVSVAKTNGKSIKISLSVTYTARFAMVEGPQKWTLKQDLSQNKGSSLFTFSQNKYKKL